MEALRIEKVIEFMTGTLYAVGVGPGDPELMTLKAARIIRECQVIAIPHDDPIQCTAYQIARGAVPEMKEKPVILSLIHISINLRHVMNFGNVPFQIKILNTDSIVTNMLEFVQIAGNFV